jgi:hypothetical protein
MTQAGLRFLVRSARQRRIEAILREFVGIFSVADLKLYSEERLGHSTAGSPL